MWCDKITCICGYDAVYITGALRFKNAFQFLSSVKFLKLDSVYNLAIFIWVADGLILLSCLSCHPVFIYNSSWVRVLLKLLVRKFELNKVLQLLWGRCFMDRQMYRFHLLYAGNFIQNIAPRTWLNNLHIPHSLPIQPMDCRFKFISSWLQIMLKNNWVRTYL